MSGTISFVQAAVEAILENKVDVLQKDKECGFPVDRDVLVSVVTEEIAKRIDLVLDEKFVDKFIEENNLS